jgi:riboflavin synthase
MFTGLIQHVGRVTGIETTPDGVLLKVDPQGWDHQPSQGDSIAINGCCLTILEDPGTEPSGTSRHRAFRFDVVPQTLNVTTLGRLKLGDAVNLEHAVMPTTLLGGHIVQGHIDGVGKVIDVRAVDSDHRITIVPPEELMHYITERGSIAIDGVALTVAEVGENWFEVALIPTTLRKTNLGTIKKDSVVNLETDYLAKVVVNVLRKTRLGGDGAKP